MFYTCLIIPLLIKPIAMFNDREDYFNHDKFALPEFTIDPKMFTTTTITTTTILPWLTTTTTRSTKTRTTTTTPFGLDLKKTQKFFIVHDWNSSVLEDAAIPITKPIPPYMTGHVSLSPPPTVTTTTEYPDIVPPPLSDFTQTTTEDYYSYLTTTTEFSRVTRYYSPEASTLNATAAIVAGRSLGSSFVDLTHKKRAIMRSPKPQADDSPPTDTTPSPVQTLVPTKTPWFRTTTTTTTTTTATDTSIQQNITEPSTSETSEHPNTTVQTEAAMKSDLNKLFSEDDAETVPFKFSFATTKLSYEDVVEYEDLQTEPFSKYLELFLLRLAKMNDTLTARILTRFATRLRTLIQNGKLIHFGPTTTRYIEHCTGAVEVPNDLLKRLVIMGYNEILHRRKVASADINSLLDFVDMLLTPEEELNMERILNDTLEYPNGKKEHREIVEDFIRFVILEPTWRVSGTVNGKILFDSITKIILARHKDRPVREMRRHVTYGRNTDIDANIKRYIEINDKFIKRNRDGRVKIKIIEKDDEDAIKRRKNDFEVNNRIADNRKNKYSSKPIFGKSTRMRNFDVKHWKNPIYNDIPKVKFGGKENWNLKMSRETESPLKSLQEYLKYDTHHKNIKEKHKNHMKRIYSNMVRQRVTFMGNNSEVKPFNLITAPLSNNMPAFNNGFINLLNLHKKMKNEFHSTQMVTAEAPVTPLSQMTAFMPAVESSTKVSPNQGTKTIQKFGDYIEVHKYAYTKSPINYIRMQPSTDKNPDYTEYISFEINNISNVVSIGMKLKFQKTVSVPQTEPSSRASMNYQETSPASSIASNQPIIDIIRSRKEITTWSPYKMNQYFEKSKAVKPNDAKLNILRTRPTVSVDNDNSLFDLYEAYTLKKGLEIPVLDETTVSTVSKVMSESRAKDRELFRKIKKTRHMKRKRHKQKHNRHRQKHNRHRHDRRESIRQNRHTHKSTEKKRHHHKHRNHKQQRHHKTRYRVIDRHNRRNNLDSWDYYLKRARDTEQSEDAENFDSLDSSSTDNENDIISSDDDDTESNSGMEIIWYDKNETDKTDQVTKPQHSNPIQRELQGHEKMKNNPGINKYEEIIETSIKQLQNIKISKEKKPSEHRYKDAPSDHKKPHNNKNLSHRKKPKKQMVYNKILRDQLSADIDNIKLLVGNEMKQQNDAYYNRITLLRELPDIDKTTSSTKDLSVKRPYNVYVNGVKVHKNLIDVRRKVDDLRRKNLQFAKKPKKTVELPKLLIDSEYSDDEKELKNNLNDAFRHGDRKYFRRNLKDDLIPKRGPRDDSEYTDIEAVLKQNVYKSIIKNV